MKDLWWELVESKIADLRREAERERRARSVVSAPRDQARAAARGTRWFTRRRPVATG